jgi:hypothetical protein
VKVGRGPFDPATQRALEAQYPGIPFDWQKLVDTPMPPPPPDVERWRERRKIERAAKQAARDEAAAEAAAEAAEAPTTVQPLVDADSPHVEIAEIDAPSDDDVDRGNDGDEGESITSTEPAPAASEGEKAQPAADPVRRRRRRRHRGGGGNRPGSPGE